MSNKLRPSSFWIFSSILCSLLLLLLCSKRDFYKILKIFIKAHTLTHYTIIFFACKVFFHKKAVTAAKKGRKIKTKQKNRPKRTVSFDKSSGIIRVKAARWQEGKRVSFLRRER